MIMPIFLLFTGKNQLKMSALASLTANYTDSEDEGTTPGARKHSEEISNVISEPQ